MSQVKGPLNPDNINKNDTKDSFPGCHLCRTKLPALAYVSLYEKQSILACAGCHSDRLLPAGIKGSLHTNSVESIYIVHNQLLELSAHMAGHPRRVILSPSNFVVIPATAPSGSNQADASWAKRFHNTFHTANMNKALSAIADGPD